MCPRRWCPPRLLVLITYRWHLPRAGTEAIQISVGGIWNWEKERCRWEDRKKKKNGEGDDNSSCGLEVAGTFNKAEERDGCRRWTYVSGKSTGLVLILLCKANMYSSINGHCRWSGGNTGKYIELLLCQRKSAPPHPQRQPRRTTTAPTSFKQSFK